MSDDPRSSSRAAGTRRGHRGSATPDDGGVVTRLAEGRGRTLCSGVTATGAVESPPTTLQRPLFNDSTHSSKRYGALPCQGLTWTRHLGHHPPDAAQGVGRGVVYHPFLRFPCSTKDLTRPTRCCSCPQCTDKGMRAGGGTFLKAHRGAGRDTGEARCL